MKSKHPHPPRVRSTPKVGSLTEGVLPQLQSSISRNLDSVNIFKISDFYLILRFVIFSIILVGSLFSTTSASSNNLRNDSIFESHTVDEFIDLFLNVTIYDEGMIRDADAGDIEYLKKWEGPIWYDFAVLTSEISNEEKLETIARTELASLANLIRSKVPVQMSEKISEDVFNMRVYFYADRAAYDFMIEYFMGNQDTKIIGEKMMKVDHSGQVESHKACLAVLLFFNSGSRKGEIVGADIVVPITNDFTQVRGCLHEEVVQSLGLTNDVDESIFDVDTLFDNKVEGDSLTSVDWDLLETLMRPNLTPGMTAAEVKEVLERELR